MENLSPLSYPNCAVIFNCQILSYLAAVKITVVLGQATTVSA